MKKNDGIISDLDIIKVMGRFTQDIDTLSAINLAIALLMPSDPVFVSTDPLLLKAAEAEGLATLNPEE